jgi:hypothetical protein
MSGVFSESSELKKIARIIQLYTRLPVSDEVIPGAFLESAIAHVRGATVLRTYDYVDVFHAAEQVGWSIKSTKEDTPITWKRAKLENKRALIEASHGSLGALQNLGNTIIDFCNQHAQQSIEKYHLREIGYARLILFPDRRAAYFERRLCTHEEPRIFDPAEFRWSWSVEKNTKAKEQLSALHGWHIPTNKRWWAWHGLGENQLHFTGERNWWPLETDPHAIRFALPSSERKLSFDKLLDMLEQL